MELDPGRDDQPLLEWVHVHLDAALRPEEGELPLGQMLPKRLRFGSELYVRRLESTRQGLRLSFNHDVDLPAKGTVILEPAVPFQMETTWNGVRLIGDFTPGESLTVHLKQGFPGHGSHRLTRDYQGSVRIRDLDPSFAFTQKGDVLSSRAIPELRLEGVNVRGFKVSARSVYPNNVVRLAQRPRWDEDMPETVFGPRQTHEVAVEAGLNERFKQNVPLGMLLGPNARGYHLIQVQDLDRHASRIQRLVQVTDLGVTVRATPDAVAVRVQGLARGNAVAGARVRVLTPTNQLLVEGVTDEQGVAVLRFQKSAEDRVPYMVAVDRNGDATFVDLDGFAVELADDAFGGRAFLAHDGLEAYVAFDRGVVRPGGEARATVVVRNVAGTAPGPGELVARWFGPDRKLRRTSRFTTSGAGLGLARLLTDPGASTGTWRLEVAEARCGRRLGEGHVKVEAFVPDRLEAEARLLAPLRLGGQARLHVAARWLEGGPAAKRPVRVHVRYDHHDFQTEAFPGYSFAFRRDDDSPPGGRPPLRTTLDERGEAQVRFDLPDPAVSAGSGGAGRIGQALEARIVVEVEDPSGRPVRVGLDERVLRPGFLIGVKADRDEAHLIAVTPEGTLFPTPSPIPVEVDLVQRYWSWSRVSREDGGYRYKFEVRSRTLQHHTTRIQAGRGQVRFRPGITGRHGWLAVVVRYGSTLCEQTVGDQPLKPDRLRVQGPKQPVRPGQEAELVVASPFAGTAFVTLEGTTVHATQVVQLPRGEARVRVRLPESLALPNVHAVVTLTTAQAAASTASARSVPSAASPLSTPEGPPIVPPVPVCPGASVVPTLLVAPLLVAPSTPTLDAPTLLPVAPSTPATDGPVWIVGGTSVPVAHSERATAVQLTAPGQVLPGSLVTVHVAAPGATQAVVALVDEGILRITGHPDPDPCAWFQAARRLDSRGADTGTSLLTGVRFQPVPEPGGDGDERLLGPRLEATTTATIQIVALLQGPVTLDAEGKAAVRFELPPYEGRLRAMVIAAGPEVTGGAAAPVRVAAPLGLRIAMPRMVSPGDTCSIPVTVRNGTGVAGVVSLTCTSSGGLEVEDGLVVVGDNIQARPRTLALAADEVRTLAVRVKAGPTPGDQGLTVLARVAGESRKVTGRMMVRPVARYVVERIGLVVNGTSRIAVPGQWVNGQARGRLIVDRSPGEQLRPTLESLLHYPYGCVEQTTSQCFALLAAGSLLKKLPEGHRTMDVGAGLHAGVGQLVGMQTGSGGLAMWPGGEHEYAFGSIYALDFLLAARAAGVAVPERPLTDLVEWVYQRLAKEDSVSLRAYAAEVLSRAGKPVAPWLRLLATRTTRVEDRARIALGLSQLGHDRDAAALLAGDQLFRQARREGGGLLRSPLRERAVELRARMAAAPGDARIPELVQHLCRAVRTPYAWTTQEQGQMLLALARYYDAHAAATEAVKATIQVGGKKPWPSNRASPARFRWPRARRSSSPATARSTGCWRSRVTGWTCAP